MPRPRQPGLTENEYEIMKILWSEGSLKVSDMLTRLKRTPKPAYTSLLTLVQTMEKKGYIQHERIGRAYIYSPILQEKKFIKLELKRLAKRLFNGGPGDLVLNLVKDEHLDDTEIEALKELLKDKKND